MAVKKGDNARSNRIRFIMLDADLSEDNLGELTAAITNALRPSLPGPRPIPQVLAPPSAGVQDDGNNGGSSPVASDDEVDSPESSGGDVQSKSSGGSKYKPPMPVYLHDFDMTGFKEFAAQRNPKSVSKKYLTVAIWCKEQGKAESITTNHVYTAFKTGGWPTNIRDWDATFRALVKQDWMRRVKTGEYAITPLGESEASEQAA